MNRLLVGRARPQAPEPYLLVGETVGILVGCRVGAGEGGRVGAGVGKFAEMVIVPLP